MMLPLLPHNYPWLHISPIFFFLSLSPSDRARQYLYTGLYTIYKK